MIFIPHVSANSHCVDLATQRMTLRSRSSARCGDRGRNTEHNLGTTSRVVPRVKGTQSSGETPTLQRSYSPEKLYNSQFIHMAACFSEIQSLKRLGVCERYGRVCSSLNPPRAPNPIMARGSGERR